MAYLVLARNVKKLHLNAIIFLKNFQPNSEFRVLIVSLLISSTFLNSHNYRFLLILIISIIPEIMQTIFEPHQPAKPRR